MDGQNKDLDKNLDLTKQEIEEIVHQLGDPIPPKIRHLAEEAVIKMKKEPISPREGLNISPEVMETIYQNGYNLFQAGKYKEALQVFDSLRQLDITNVRYSFAIAACYHHSKEYLEAAANYILCNHLDFLNPLYCFHLYDCFMKSDYPLSALRAIQEARVLAERNPKYAKIKEKIILEHDYLLRFLQIYLKERYERPANHPSENPEGKDIT